MNLSLIHKRADEVLRFSCRKENYLSVPEWDGEGIPPVETFRAVRANEVLDMAGMYAAKAKSFSDESEGWSNPEWAEKQAEYMERDLAEYSRLKSASPEEIWRLEAEWYGIAGE